MKQELALLQQGRDIVTAAQDQVPVLVARSSEGFYEVPMAINFLRSGCPAVQIVYQYNEFAKMENLMRALELPGESLVFQGPGDGSTRALKSELPHIWRMVDLNRQPTAKT